MKCVFEDTFIYFAIDFNQSKSKVFDLKLAEIEYFIPISTRQCQNPLEHNLWNYF